MNTNWQQEAPARGEPGLGTVEINMDKIESVDVDQSITGRAFNYGDVTIRGTSQTNPRIFSRQGLYKRRRSAL